MLALLAFLISLFAGCALAQTSPFTFAYRAEANPAPVTVAVNGTINFTQGPVGVRQSTVLLVQNRSDATWSLARLSLGGLGFSSDTNAPLTIGPGQVVPVNLAFSPTRRGIFEGTLSLDVESGSQRASLLFFLRATVLSPDLILSYIVNPSGNQLPLAADATIRFPATTAGQTSTVTMVVTNRGNGPGILDAATVAGESFRITGLPLLPFSIGPDREARFTISFAPTVRQPYTSVLSLRLDSESRTILLEGDVVGPSLSIQAVPEEGEPVSVAPEQTIRFADVAVNSPRTVRVGVRNEGNAEGRVAAILVTGTGFQLADLPALPVTLNAGAGFEFTVVFTPRESGPLTGRLRLDALSFGLAGVGLGAKLEYTLQTGSATSTVAPNGVILFPNTAVGASLTSELRLKNSGNVAATVNGISVSGSAFGLRDLPALPATVEPGQSIAVSLHVRPDAVGTLNGALQIDEARFTLRGIGTSPPPLPPILLQGPAPTLEPLQQPAIGLSFEQPYALDVTGKLTLTFTSSSFLDDPAVQFATGGRTVDFRIPAGATAAVFAEGPRQIVFQSGSVAGLIGVAATFNTSGVDVTPQPAPSLSMSVAAAAPQLRSVQIVPRTASSFDVIATGFSTSRSVSQLTLQFTTAPGVSLQGSTLTANVESAFDSWYQSSASRPFGSQFAAVLTVNISGDANALQSVSVTASNPRGTSNAVNASIR